MRPVSVVSLDVRLHYSVLAIYAIDMNTLVGIMGVSRWGGVSQKSHVAIGFLRITGTDPIEKQLDPGSNCFSGWRFVWPSVKYVDD